MAGLSELYAPWSVRIVTPDEGIVTTTFTHAFPAMICYGAAPLLPGDTKQLWRRDRLISAEDYEETTHERTLSGVLF